MALVDLLAELDHPLVPEVAAAAAEVSGHALFGALRSVADVRHFMVHHVWAVWDFMTLLKSIQAELAPVAVPWRPTGDRQAARMINSIVLAEESDIGPDGQPTSHFEVYLRAMREAGADARPIETFIARLNRGMPLERALDDAPAPMAAKRFVRSTLASTVATAPLAVRVASFTIGREDIIPAMFRQIVSQLASSTDTDQLRLLVWYLDRHVAVDVDEHGPLAWRLFEQICVRQEGARDAALNAALLALRERKLLWDAILHAIRA